MSGPASVGVCVILQGSVYEGGGMEWSVLSAVGVV